MPPKDITSSKKDGKLPSADKLPFTDKGDPLNILSPEQAAENRAMLAKLERMSEDERKAANLKAYQGIAEEGEKKRMEEDALGIVGDVFKKTSGQKPEDGDKAKGEKKYG